MTVAITRQEPDPSPPNETLGQKMRRLRTELGLSMREVAEIAGTTTQTIFAWENGKRYGMTAESAALPRRVIRILAERRRRRAKRNEQQ